MKNNLRMVHDFHEWDCGVCGEKAPFKDSNGDTLYTGDVVVVLKEDKIIGTFSIVKDGDEGKIFVMGIEASCPNYEADKWKIYKEKSYMSMKAGDTIDFIKYVRKDLREMTITEIEKELGYSIKIVSED